MKANPYAELLKALQVTTQPDSDGMTTNEIAEALVCNVDMARKRLKAAIRAGKVVYSGVKTGTRMDGRAYTAPAYKLKGAR